MSLRNLDDSAFLTQIDSSQMLQRICEMPFHLEAAFKAGVKSAIEAKNIKSVVFFGLGGSAVAGEIVCQKLSHHWNFPALVIKKSTLPAFIDENTLCVALSYSGNTKETIDCYKEAIKRGCKVIAITSGGNLEKLSAQNKNVIVKLEEDFQPRAALGLLIGATFGSLEKVHLIEDAHEIVAKTVELLHSLKEKYAPDALTEVNQAKKIALKLLDHLPLVYASESLGLATSGRWKTQLNENAKVMAFSNVFPELAHNEIMSASELSGSIIIYLKNPDEDADSLIANSIALKLMKPHEEKLLEIASVGESQMEKMLSLIYLGDFVSAYLAILRGVDPTPVEHISRLKKELKQRISLKTTTLDTIES